MNPKEPWYAAKCIFLHGGISQPKKKACYEERITLIRARGFKEALRKGEAEARRYAKSLQGTEYLGFISVYHLFDSKIGDGTEIYSVMQSIRLSRRDYLRRYTSGGRFHEQDAAKLR